jgi:hypothetical protein
MSRIDKDPDDQRRNPNRARVAPKRLEELQAQEIGSTFKTSSPQSKAKPKTPPRPPRPETVDDGQRLAKLFLPPAARIVTPSFREQLAGVLLLQHAGKRLSLLLEIEEKMGPLPEEMEVRLGALTDRAREFKAWVEEGDVILDRIRQTLVMPWSNLLKNGADEDMESASGNEEEGGMSVSDSGGEGNGEKEIEDSDSDENMMTSIE